MVRAVIDTNVLVSALIHDGKPRELVLELFDRHTVILSRQMLAELADVAGRDKFQVEKVFVATLDKGLQKALKPFSNEILEKLKIVEP